MAMNPSAVDVYTDFSNFSTLKTEARANAPDALEKVAKQFESIFMQMILKSMREASFGDGIFDSEQSELYRDLYDKQLSLHLGRESGLGLAELISRQLGERTGKRGPDRGMDLDDYRAQPIRNLVRNDSLNKGADRNITPRTFSVLSTREVPKSHPFTSQQDFIDALRPHAIRAGKQLGVHPGVLLAQAALESGWGKKQIRNPDGQNSNNLFGIKADNRWKGQSTLVSTLEYEDGIAVRQRDRFRSYQGIAESFEDYVRFIRENPRYGEALHSAGDPRDYIEALQKAGYATDPDYAEKVMNIFDQRGFSELESKQA